MILDKVKLLNHLIFWLQEYCAKNDIHELVFAVGWNGQVFEDYQSKSIGRLSRLSKIKTHYHHDYKSHFFKIREIWPNALILGPYDKGNLFLREYIKGCEGDLLPFGDLYPAEVAELFDNDLNFELARDVEFALRQEELTQIVSSKEDPVRHPAWLGYTGPQRKLIAKLHQREKKTRHKENPNIPICKIRDIEGLVR